MSKSSEWAQEVQEVEETLRLGPFRLWSTSAMTETSCLWDRRRGDAMTLSQRNVMAGAKRIALQAVPVDDPLDKPFVYEYFAKSGGRWRVEVHPATGRDPAYVRVHMGDGHSDGWMMADFLADHGNAV